VSVLNNKYETPCTSFIYLFILCGCCDKLGEEGEMEQYTTTTGDQIVVQAANGQIQQQVRVNVNSLLYNQ